MILIGKEVFMSRAAQVLKSKVLIVAVIVVALAGVGTGVWAYESNPGNVHTTINAQKQTTDISYQGQSGQNALALLEKYATVKTKHYSFGDMVTSIDGTVGNGPKYWTFYVNNKEASVGAGSYMTKNSDTLTWKLQ